MVLLTLALAFAVALAQPAGRGRLPAFTSAARQRAAAAEAAQGSSGPADSWTDRSLWIDA